MAILFDRLGFSVAIRPQQSFLMATIIRNIGATLLRATLLEYLEKRRYLELRRKIRSIRKWNKEIEEVGSGEINKDADLKSRSLMLILRLLELYTKTRFNK